MTMLVLVLSLIGYSASTHAQIISPLGHLRPELEVAKQWYGQVKWLSDGKTEVVTDALSSVKEFLITDANTHLKKEKNISLECVDSILRFGLDLVKREPYTLLALDADGKVQSGIYKGNVRWSGRYHECRNIKTQHYTGKWCEAALGTQINVLSRGSTIGMSIGLCLPDVCSEEYITKRLQPLANKTNTALSLKCPEQPSSWTATDIASLTTFCLVAAFLIFGTMLDMFLGSEKSENKDQDPFASGNGLYFNPQKNQSLWIKIALSFSIIKNTKTLLNTERGPDTIDVLHGMRFLSIAWVVLGHSYIMQLFYIKNFVDVADWYNSAFSFQIISNATFSVDTFFFIGGLLVTYLSLKRMERSEGKLNVWKMYLLRYIRLTPPYAFVIFFVVGFYGKLGDGPMWPDSWQGVKASCDIYWWTNLLYINNLHPSTLLSECFALGWYLANDMQFFLLAPISIFLLYRKPKIGINLLVFGIFSSVLVTGILSAHFKELPQPVAISALLRLLLPANGNNSTNGLGINPPASPTTDFWSDLYAKPWCRIAVYLVGMITGYILHKTKGKIKMSKLFVAFGWILSGCLSSAVLFGIWPYISSDTPMTISLAAFYNSMCRLVWSVALAWVVIACFSGYGGIVSKFLGWNLFIPLSRLTYCIYLVHTLVLLWWQSTQEVPGEFSNKQFAFNYLGALTFSVAVAYLFAMLFEAPFINLTKLGSTRQDSNDAASDESLVDNDQLQDTSEE